MEKVDQSLTTSVTQEKTSEYKLMEEEYQNMVRQYKIMIEKYSMMMDDPLVPETEQDNIVLTERFEDTDPKILSRNFCKFAKLSRDVEWVRTRASVVLGSLEKKENMMQHKKEGIQEKRSHEHDLQVFNEYVDTVSKHLSEKKNRVGITGPSGVGKTTVTRKLHDELLVKKSSGELDKIIWIEEKKTGVLELQEEIMVQLQTDHQKTISTVTNADRISSFLSQKRYVLLMDHVSENIDLNKLGIREDHEFGSVVIASNYIQAIRMMIRDTVEIKILDEENAWHLFESICGEVKDRREGTGRLIVKCCGGLPRLIKYVATLLKDLPDESSWLHIKGTLQSPPDSLDMMSLVGFDRFFKENYVKLETRSQKCFLYAALFPSDETIHRDYLTECWMAECFLEDDETVQGLRDSRVYGQRVLDNLTDVFLLNWCSDRKYVKMTSMCRRFALHQAYPGEEKCSTWVNLDKKAPTRETWTTVTRMSLIGCKEKLPERLECPNMYTLFLWSKPEPKMIPDSLFLHMSKLLVLNVYDTEIQLLPSSINKLVNLKCLYLNCCKHLGKLPSTAAELKKLQCLDIRGTSIRSLPQEIGEMVELRCLRASFSPQAGSIEVIIPLDIIKKLKVLEELSIDTGLYRPPVEMAEKLAKELASLKYLSTLHFNFPNISSFNTFVAQSESLKNMLEQNIDTNLDSSTFRSFKIFVGSWDGAKHAYESDFVGILAERRLRFSLNEESSSGCQEILKQASSFELIGDKSVETLSEFDLKYVEVCVVGDCKRLKSIVKSGKQIHEIKEESSGGVHKNLKKLHLYDLPLLQCVWEGTIPNMADRSLFNLVVLTLKGCPKLTKILDLPLARTLPKLKHLIVENCCEVTQMLEIPEESSSSEPVDLPGLLNNVEIIELINLSNLKSICSSRSLSWNSLNSMVIREFSKLSNLSLTETNAPKLAFIECEKRWSDRLSLPDLKDRKLPFRQPRGESSELGETSTDARHQASNNSDEPSTSNREASNMKSNGVEIQEEGILNQEGHKPSEAGRKPGCLCIWRRWK